MEAALERDSRDLPSCRRAGLKRILGRLVPERNPNSLYYCFWPARKISGEKARGLVQEYFVSRGYGCVVLAEEMYAFQKPGEPLKLVSVNRGELGEDELIVVCESEIIQGKRSRNTKLEGGENGSE